MTTVLQAKKRGAGKRSTLTQLRKGGRLAAVLYGYQTETMPISLDYKETAKAVLRYGYTGVFKIEVEGKQAIVDAIIQMAHRLQMKVVAEGVENGQQMELLRKMGCDYIQGYYYSKPLPMDELIEFIQFWEVEHQGSSLLLLQ